MSIGLKIKELKNKLPSGIILVAVSKTYPETDILEAYQAGQRVFGESRPQEMTAKYETMPKDIEWHMIGHLQTNKVKYIAPYVSLIHSVDSARLLETINKEALKIGRIIDVLLEIYIAQEESKHGWSEEELTAYLQAGEYRKFEGIRFRGVMGIATYTDNREIIQQEFTTLHKVFKQLQKEYFTPAFDTVSMGMTHDYQLAVECGSTMVRIGSYIFGDRTQ